MNAEQKLAIHELLHRAAYALDEHDLEMLESCFAEHAVMSINIAGELVGPFDGLSSIMQLMADSMAQQSDQRRHVCANIFFQAEGDDVASVVSNLTLFATENGTIRLITAGVYHDEVAKVNGQWKLVKRHLDLDLPY